MNSPDPQKTVELLRPMAVSLVHAMRDHFLAHDVDAFQFYNCDNTPMIGVWAGERKITFRCPNQGAEVSFTNLGIKPPTPGDIEVTLEQEGESKVVDSLVRRTKNDSDVDLSRNLKWTDAESEASRSRDAGMQEVTAGLELGMRTTLGVEAGGELYGGSVKAEQEFTATLSAAYTQAWERETESTKGSEKTTESEWEFDIKARHASVFRSIVEEVPMRETTRAKGVITFGIGLHAPGHWHFGWPNLKALLANFRGVPYSGDVGFFVRDEIAKPYQKLFQKHPLPNAESLPIFQDVCAEFEYSRLIKDSKQFDTEFTMEPLNQQAAVKAALDLIAEHGPRKLRKDAAAEAAKWKVD